MIEPYITKAEQDCQEKHTEINHVVEANQKRVLDAFRHHRVSDSHFHSTTGYGYDDTGRETLEAVYAEVFGGEDALVRPQIVSGTHAISTALFGLLRPGDELVFLTGKPYDTLGSVIGKSDYDKGALTDFGIEYREVPLLADGDIDYFEAEQVMSPKTKVIGIQRSKGYDDRPSFTIKQIREMVQFIKAREPNALIFVDNCYGEFAEEKEPLHVGADVIAGSLIKNPGGGIVRAGGYIAGRADLVELCAHRLTAPGLGQEMGATFDMLQEMYQGFFLAPHVVGQALKGAVFTACFLELIGYTTSPHYMDVRTDLIQSVDFPDAEQMIAFCQTIQQNSPVNAFVTPVPSSMPGYDDDVIMAAGTFIQGASLELTADGPIRPPYTAYVQGGLTYEHVKIALKEAIEYLMEEGLLTLK